MPAAARVCRGGDQHARARRHPGSDALGVAGVPPQSGSRQLSSCNGACALRLTVSHAAARAAVQLVAQSVSKGSISKWH